MFLKRRTRTKDGKCLTYYSFGESLRVSRDRIVQRQVLQLGELNTTQLDSWQHPMSWQVGYGLESGRKSPWGNGDGRLLYPPRRPLSDMSPCLDGPVNSLRWENLRDGMEDYEYFWLLNREIERVASVKGETKLVQEARALLKLPAEISEDLKHFTTDPRLMLQHRERVARMIERLRRFG